MTKLLEKALAELAKLPDQDKDFIAQVILDELADEAGWQRRFRNHPEVLEQLLREAEADIAAGRVEPLDIDKLR